MHLTIGKGGQIFLLTVLEEPVAIPSAVSCYPPGKLFKE